MKFCSSQNTLQEHKASVKKKRKRKSNKKHFSSHSASPPSSQRLIVNQVRLSEGDLWARHCGKYFIVLLWNQIFFVTKFKYSCAPSFNTHKTFTFHISISDHRMRHTETAQKHTEGLESCQHTYNISPAHDTNPAIIQTTRSRPCTVCTEERRRLLRETIILGQLLLVRKGKLKSSSSRYIYKTHLGCSFFF